VRRTAKTGVNRSWQAPLDLSPIWEFGTDLKTARLGRTYSVIPGPISSGRGLDEIAPE
jgi:hypothetical protein